MVKYAAIIHLNVLPSKINHMYTEMTTRMNPYTVTIIIRTEWAECHHFF